MSTKLRRGIAAAAASTLMLTLVACSATDDPAPTSTGDGGETSDEADPGAYEGQRVGAMDEFGVDTVFQATEPLDFSLLYRDHPSYPVLEDWLIFEELESKNNVTFSRVDVPLADWDDRKSLLLGAGDFPTIVPVTYPGQESQFVAGGALLPVSDYLDLLPNFTDKVAKWGLEDELELLRQEDGKFYLLPGLHENLRPQYSIAVRKDIWDGLGLNLEPATWDEFADQLRQVKEAHPEFDFPYSDRWQLNATINVAASTFGTAGGWGLGQGVWWNGSEYVLTGATDEYREMLTYFNGLVSDGLLDPESLTQDDDPAIQKFVSGQAAAIGTNDQTVMDYRNLFDEAGNTDAEVYQIRAPAGPAGDILAGSRFESGQMLNADLADSEHLVATLQFVDWLYYSDNGLEFAKWGVEGTTFERDADGTRRFLGAIDQGGINPSDDPEPLNATYGFHNGVWMPAHGSTFDLGTSMMREEVQEWQNAMATKEMQPIAPAWPLTELEQEEASILVTALNDQVTQNTSRFILGQRSLDEWDAYVSELANAGQARYLEIVNGAQQRAAG